MKNISVLIALLVMISGSVLANSLKEEEASRRNFKESDLKRDESVSNDEILNKSRAGEDVFLTLSKNSRLLKLSTNYLVQTLSGQINWEYRSKIYFMLNQKLIIDEK